jgi:uncharacterized membrane protein YkvA (DUF1232 family)
MDKILVFWGQLDDKAILAGLVSRVNGIQGRYKWDNQAMLNGPNTGILGTIG